MPQTNRVQRIRRFPSRVATRVFLSAICLCLLSSCRTPIDHAAESESEPAPNIVEPSLLPLTERLDNPFRGWVAYARPADRRAPDAFDSVSLLVDWAELEPVEGEFNWAPLETAIATQARSSLSARLYLMPDPYWRLPGRPPWIDALFPPVWCGETDPKCQLAERGWSHPPYWDPAYRERAQRFLTAFAHRFAERFDYIDVRAYGIYGEWDSDHKGAFPWQTLSPSGLSKRSVLREWIDLYRLAFTGRGTPLVINLPAYPKVTDAYLSESALDYALQSGFSIRYDAFRPHPPVPYARLLMRELRGNQFLVAEPGYREESLPGEQRRACGWCPAGAEETLREMLEMHATFASLGVEPSQWEDFIGRHSEIVSLGHRALGYRLAFQRAKVPARATTPSRFSIEIEWINRGIAALSRPATVWLFLLNADGDVVWSDSDQCQSPGWSQAILPSDVPLELALPPKRTEPTTSEFCFDLPETLETGHYSIRVSLQVGSKRIALGQVGGSEGRTYPLGEVHLTAKNP